MKRGPLARTPLATAQTTKSETERYGNAISTYPHRAHCHAV